MYHEGHGGDGGDDLNDVSDDGNVVGHFSKAGELFNVDVDHDCDMMIMIKE